jgi:hypothetical protein
LEKDESAVLTKEREAERSERERASKMAAGGSFLGRRKVWKDEKRRIKELRDARQDEIQALRRKERSDEEKLGQGTPPVSSQDKK